TVHEDRVVSPRATPRGLLLISTIVAAAAALSLGKRLRWGRGVRLPRPLAARRVFSLGAAVLGATMVPYALTLRGALSAPPRGSDALWYHLPMAVGFSRAQHLEPPGRDLVFYFPGNVEILARTFFDALGPHALPLIQWPFAFGAATAAA